MRIIGDSISAADTPHLYAAVHSWHHKNSNTGPWSGAAMHPLEHLSPGRRMKLRLGDFFHQLHHRYCDCNYGTSETPWDRWLDSYHNGTEEGEAWMKQRRPRLSQQKSPG